MTAKELKDILTNVPDDAVVVVCNPRWQSTEIIGSQFVAKDRSWRSECGTLYLDIKNFKRL